MKAAVNTVCNVNRTWSTVSCDLPYSQHPSPLLKAAQPKHEAGGKSDRVEQPPVLLLRRLYQGTVVIMTGDSLPVQTTREVSMVPVKTRTQTQRSRPASVAADRVQFRCSVSQDKAVKVQRPAGSSRP